MRSISGTTSTSSISSTMSSQYINQSQTIPLLSGSSSGVPSQRLDWESLRKQARQLENEIDSKLVAFSKLCSNYTTSMLTSRPTSSSVGQQQQQNGASSGANSSSSDLMFMTLSNELEEAIKKLTNINTKMGESLNMAENASINSNATIHTLQRHRDILRDYSIEYEKTKRNIIQFKEREKLLSSSNTQRSSLSSESNLNNRMKDSTSLYMKEHDHLKSSHLLIDQQIELAELSKEKLQSQNQAIRFFHQKLNTIAHKFPMINNLMQKVKFKKRKDSLILATVIAICIIILLLYLF